MAEQLISALGGPASRAEGWIDGPALAVWIKQRLGWTMQEHYHGSWCQYTAGRCHYKEVGYRGSRATQRRINAWERGARADIYAADRILIDLGLYLSDVPDELWNEA